MKHQYQKWQYFRTHSLTDRGFSVFLLACLYRKFVRAVKMPLALIAGTFLSTNIETFGHCNRNCSFCFVSDIFPDRENGVMPWETWKKIVDELSAMHFSGRISPYFYGEPLLDKRLPDLLRYARQKCPHALISINTNGDMLNDTSLYHLVKSGVDRLVVTDYDDTPQEGLKELAGRHPWCIQLRHQDSFPKTNRGGAIFNRPSAMAERPCLRPATQLVINWQGKVVLCCNDYYARHAFGDVNEQSIQAIWQSDRMLQFRNTLKKTHGRQAFDICRNCDASDKYVF